MIAQPVTAFDFFQTFFGGQNQGQQRDGSGDRGQASSATNANECSDYICPQPSPSASTSKICVVDPRDCPCVRPALETKCPMGDWYTCVPNSIVPSVDGCKAYLSKLNGPAVSGGADAGGKRSEL
ncbi:hypothetical protein BCR44DRAFT_49587 [Catenaria anguillulae PL171]|uniref:Long chronological lifespan protein 2 n=1 Tax=Catenaria anguillulae PL171 TaxID=765915 RepID=A0A1Y2HSX2_9FUNG|nr:hypothetical protein BCR44DRAFT_49587 [Catenaria anguillulae PL171]